MTVLDGRELEQVHVILGLPGLSFSDPDYYVLSVLSTLLGGGMSSRLFQEVREKRGLAYSIYSFSSSYVDGGLFGIYAGTGDRQVAELMPVICDEFLKIGERVGEREFERARTQIKAGLLMSRESTGARCEHLAHQLHVFGRPVPVDEIVGRVDAVTPDRVIALARRLAASPLTMTALGPTKHLPSFDSVAAQLQ